MCTAFNFKKSNAPSSTDCWKCIPIQNFHLLKVLVVAWIAMVGCSASGSYREEHRVENLNVIFLDQRSLHKEWTARTGQSGVEFVGFRAQTTSSVKTLQGFFDFTTNTLYCPKWNFEVCGHELHHAVLGHFHEAP